ncbi:MAG: hypothetical protein GWN30_01745, partial [Gammaproteobacteria bacterium]|nr:hypothetical protein [Gammaproteobacteria bacterium]
MILSIRRFSLSRMVLMGAILILILALNTIPSGASSHLSLNEIVVSTTGSDREFFEIAGASGDSLDGVFFLEVTSGGAIDTVLDLSGEAIPADGYWLAASPEA